MLQSCTQATIELQTPEKARRPHLLCRGLKAPMPPQVPALCLQKDSTRLPGLGELLAAAVARPTRLQGCLSVWAHP